MKEVLLVGFGGFIGSILRFWISKLNQTVSFFSIPIGTLTVNILGSFIIGFLVSYFTKHADIESSWKLFFITGICGGFTTFSTFSHENLSLLQNGNYGVVILYASLSVVLGIIAAYAGFIFGN